MDIIRARERYGRFRPVRSFSDYALMVFFGLVVLSIIGGATDALSGHNEETTGVVVSKHFTPGYTDRYYDTNTDSYRTRRVPDSRVVFIRLDTGEISEVSVNVHVFGTAEEGKYVPVIRRVGRFTGWVWSTSIVM